MDNLPDLDPDKMSLKELARRTYSASVQHQNQMDALIRDRVVPIESRLQTVENWVLRITGAWGAITLAIFIWEAWHR